MHFTLLIPGNIELVDFCSIEEVAFSFNGGKDSTVSYNCSLPKRTFGYFLFFPCFLSGNNNDSHHDFRYCCIFLELAIFCIRKSRVVLMVAYQVFQSVPYISRALLPSLKSMHLHMMQLKRKKSSVSSAFIFLSPNYIF